MTDDEFKRIKDLIEDTIAEYRCPPCEEDEWLTTKKICARLDTSEPTLRKMRRNGRHPIYPRWPELPLSIALTETKAVPPCITSSRKFRVTKPIS